MIYILPALGLIFMLAIIIDANIQYNRERANMTPEERKRDDEEAKYELQQW